MKYKTAHRRRYKAKRELRVPKFVKRILAGVFIILGISLLIPTIAFLLPTKSLWGSSSRISLAVPHNDGDMFVFVFDKEQKSIITINIPKNTQVDVARQLGSWRISSLKRLDDQEKQNGKLITRTLLKTFHLPVKGWADEPALGFLSSNPWEVIRASFSPYRSSLSLKDKIQLGLFALKVPSSDTISIDLVKNGNLVETTFIDSEEGYAVKDSLTPGVLSYFTENKFLEKTPRVSIINAGASSSSTEKVAQIIEVVGAHVLSIQKADHIETDLSCSVAAKEDDLGTTTSDILGCDISSEKPKGNFDIEITMGEKFSKEF